MADWRAISGIPLSELLDATPPLMPTGMRSMAQSGRVQTRNTTQVGRTWTETYPAMPANSARFKRLIAGINRAHRNQEVFEVEHPNFNGLAEGSTLANAPVVGAAGQSGGFLVLATPTSGVILAGSVIHVVGVGFLLDVTEDVPNGTTALTINPPIPVSQSPAAGAVITYAGAKFNAILDPPVKLPTVEPGFAFSQLKLNWREVPV